MRTAAVSTALALAISTATAATAAPARAAIAAAPKPAPAVSPDGMRGLAGATRVLVVSAWSPSSTHASVRAYQLRDGHYRLVHGPMAARLGYNGLSMPRHRHAGDGTTPMGVYGFVFDFGSRANPGVVGYRWRSLVPGSCWSGSKRSYNRWVHRTPCWSADEDLWASHKVAYRYAAVIDFNYRHPVFGRGAGIFLHERLPRATHGCVSLYQKHLLWALRWLRPGSKVVIGTAHYLHTLKG